MAYMAMAVRRFRAAFVEVRRAQTRVGHQVVPRCAAGATARMAGQRTFTVESDRFLLDGEPLQIISGSVHYFRIHPAYWKDRLQRIAALGCNAIEVYVPWNWHEPQHGQLRFDGWHDLEGFLRLAHGMALRILLRPGPYICAEWELGGLPAWLLNPSVTGTDSIGLRSHDPVYMKFVQGWWETLLPRMVPLLHRNGGPIVMVQVENELGFFGPDEAYMRELVSLARRHLGDDVLLFTTDPPHVLGKGSLRGGDVLSLVDFGTDMDLHTAFWAQNRFNPPGMSPPFCTEFYCGWLTHWGEPMARTDGQELATALQNLLEFANGTGNVNLYMAHGGTTFGFWQGANDDHRGYRPGVTSYDYHCPISEAGGYDHPGLGGQSKYRLLRSVIAGHTGRALPEPPPPPHIQDYGTITVLQQLPLLDALPQLSCPRPIASQHPLPMEHYGIYYGFILYRATLEPGRLQQGGLLAFKAADYVQVFLDGSLVASWDRNHPHPVRLPAGTGAATLDIFVESMGRNNFFRDRADCKGILSRVTVDGTPVSSWTVYGLPLERPQSLDDMWRALPPHNGAVEAAGQPSGGTVDASAVRLAEAAAAGGKAAEGAEGPRFFSGTFWVEAPGQLQESGHPCDSYLSMAAWRKGVVWVNGFNLGRYWTAKGPQRTLYVPGPVLVVGENRVVVLELDPQDPLPPVLQCVTLPDFGCQPLPSAPGPLAGLEKALRSTGLCLWQFLYGAWLRCCV